MIGSTYSEILHTTFNGWRVLNNGELALDMPADCCCDMRGAIKIAKNIMPTVWRIATFADNQPDIEYRLRFDGEWVAFERCNTNKAEAE
jgi:hypothetical protein